LNNIQTLIIRKSTNSNHILQLQHKQNKLQYIIPFATEEDGVIYFLAVYVVVLLIKGRWFDILPSSIRCSTVAVAAEEDG